MSAPTIPEPMYPCLDCCDHSDINHYPASDLGWVEPTDSTEAGWRCDDCRWEYPDEATPDPPVTLAEFIKEVAA